MLEEKLVLREESLVFVRGTKFILVKQSDNAIEDECKNLPIFEYFSYNGRFRVNVNLGLIKTKSCGDGAKVAMDSGLMETYSLDEARTCAYDLARRQAEIISKLSGLELVDEVKIERSKSDGRDKC